MRDAQVGDIYVDDGGKLWRVRATCSDPTVEVEEVEPSKHSSDPTDGPLTDYQQINPAVLLGGKPKGNFIRVRKSGGVNGRMWDGFKRIFRQEVSTP